MSSNAVVLSKNGFNLWTQAGMVIGLVIWMAMPTSAWTQLGEASNQQEEFSYLGFGDGDYGWGASFGQPVSLRYQVWKQWNRAVAYELGFQPSDEYVMGSASYVWYYLTESDRWRRQDQIGLIMYRGTLGAVVGAYTGEKPDQKFKLGAKALVGFEYLFPATSWSLFVDLGMGLLLSGNEVAEVNGGVGITYYFNKSGKSGVRGDKKLFGGSRKSKNTASGNESKQEKRSKSLAKSKKKSNKKSKKKRKKKGQKSKKKKKSKKKS